MCFGKPKAPAIVYQGPSEQDIADQRQILGDYTATSEKNTLAFQNTINEQIATGSIEIVDNQVILTDKGKAMLKAFSFIKIYFLPKMDNKNSTDEDLLIK